MDIKEVFNLAKQMFPERYVSVSLSLTRYYHEWDKSEEDATMAQICVQEGECFIGSGKTFIEAFGDLAKSLPKDTADDGGEQDEDKGNSDPQGNPPEGGV